ncbi:MAG: hypothetical protein ACLFTY_04030 [Candidatus Aenigmatarchaeota archaeon]
MTRNTSRLAPMFVIAVIQLIVIVPVILLSYTLMSSFLEFGNLFFHYTFSGLLGLALGLILITIINKRFDVDGGSLNYYGASSGLFGLSAVLYSSWIISPGGYWPYETIFSGASNIGSPMNIWIAAFVYYMLFNTPFVYIYFYQKQIFK